MPDISIHRHGDRWALLPEDAESPTEEFDTREAAELAARDLAQGGRIEVREDGLTHSVRIGDAVDFEIEDVVPFGVESGEPARLSGIFHPAGSELTIARATRSSINAFGIDYEGKSAFSTSHFEWAA